MKLKLKLKLSLAKIEAKKEAKTGEMKKKKLGIEEDQVWELSKTLETDKAVGATGLIPDRMSLSWPSSQVF